MSDLTDERLGQLMKLHDDNGSAEIRDALIELRQHRAARDADKERVRMVVKEQALLTIDETRAFETTNTFALANAIAARVADQLGAKP